MSSAVYPLGMNSMPSSGYNHKSTYYNKRYITWKGSGLNSNPTGYVSSHIRPLTNNDPGNVFPTGFGLPRPLKHYRKGRQLPSASITDTIINEDNPNDPNNNFIIREGALINYNLNRVVKSSKGTSLGGGAGGSGLLNELLDKPSSYIIKENNYICLDNDKYYLTFSTPNINSQSPVGIFLGQTTDIFNIFINNCFSLKDNCKDCKGVSVVVDYYPNKGYLTENPEPNTTNPILCCNPEYKAKRRAIYASSNLNKNYYTTTKQYLQNRCKTYDQKAFNFLSVKSNNAGTYDNNNPYYATLDGSKAPKPGSPASLANTYLANCQLNTQLYEGSELAFIYKLLSIMQTQGILTQEQINNFNSSGINSLMGFFDYLQTLSEPSKTQALKVFELFLNDPYNGMPPSGPSNPAGCQLTVYKPNNYQYAKQGAVDSSTRNLKLNVSTISTNSASINNYNNTGQQLVTANQIYAGNNPNIINLQKNKGPSCGTQLPLNFYQSGPYQNKKFCTYTSLPQYINPQTQPSPYRYYPGTVFSSNHYSQSPNTYNTSSGSGRFR